MCLSAETAKAILAELKRQGLTQRDLANRLGQKEQYVSNVLNGRTSISMKMADKMVRALDCQIRVVLEDRT